MRRLWWMSELELTGSNPPTPFQSRHGAAPAARRSADQASCFFTYVGPFSRLLWGRIRELRTFHLGYSGEVDDKGRPHGWAPLPGPPPSSFKGWG